MEYDDMKDFDICIVLLNEGMQVKFNELGIVYFAKYITYEITVHH